MASRVGRVGVIAAAMAAIFASVVLILLRVLPGPRKDTDYLVIGTLATFAALVTLYLMLSRESVMKDLFHRRRKDYKTDQ